MLSPDDTICAVASATGGAARGIVRLSGPGVAAILERCFGAVDQFQAATVVEGELAVGGPIARIPGRIFFWPDKRNYTRQPTAEFHTLGSPPLLAAAVRTFCEQGARPAEPGEFTLRAFLAGRLDLTQAEAVLGVIDATEQQPFKAALAQLAGGISRPLHDLRERLLELLAHLEAGLDFIEEDIEFISPAELDASLTDAEQIVTLLEKQLAERATTVSPRVVLFGLPNVGKSSLFNAIVGRAASIVSPHVGTTRDYLTATINLNGTTYELIDTAGVTNQSTDNSIEVAAQAASELERDAAQLRVLCLDATRPLEKIEHGWLKSADNASLFVLTKTDQLPATDYQGPVIATSSKSGTGIAELIVAIRGKLREQPGDAVVGTAERCADSLRLAAESLVRARTLNQDRAGEELIAAEVRLALQELGKVVGAVYTDDILDRVFSRFCIGK